MIVALIGCDCSGKSTCFNKMNKSLGTFIKGRQIDKIGAQYLRDIEGMADSDDLYIFDRIPIIDDFVYSPVFARKQSDLILDLQHVKRVAEKCIFIYFKCSVETLKSRMISRGDEYVKPEQIDEIIRSYNITFDILNIEPEIISTEENNEDQVVEKVMEVLRCKLPKLCQ